MVAINVAFKAEDGTPLSGVTFGTGPHGVLLLPQRGSDLCGWWDYATELSGQGFQVASDRLAGYGLQRRGHRPNYMADAIGAVAQLRRTGAQKVVVVGASVGAATALVTAGRSPDQIAGVVSLSYPDETWTSPVGPAPAPHTPTRLLR